MTSVAEFLPDFADCLTIKETNETYKRIVNDLREAHRLAMSRIVHLRDNPPSETARTRRDNSDVWDQGVKNWAVRTGVVMPASGRVTNSLRDAYRKAHDPNAQMPQDDEKEMIVPTDHLIISASEVRSWAALNGIQCGARGRIAPDVQRRYSEAHGD